MIIAIDIEHPPARAGVATEVTAEPSDAMRDIPDRVMRWFFDRFSHSAFDRIQRMPDDSIAKTTIYEHEGYRFTWDWASGTRVVSFCLLAAPVDMLGYVFARPDAGNGGGHLYLNTLGHNIGGSSVLLFVSEAAAEARWLVDVRVPFDAPPTPEAHENEGVYMVTVPVAADELTHSTIAPEILRGREKSHGPLFTRKA